MKNRSEIGYLTILGLSLTVVLTVYKENKPLKTSVVDAHEIVKAHLLQTGKAGLSSSFNNNIFLSQKGSCFLFSNSPLFSSVFLSENNQLSGLQLFESSFLRTWLESSGEIRIHISSFFRNKRFSNLPKLDDGDRFFLDGFALNSDNSFAIKHIDNQQSQLFGYITEFSERLIQNSTPSRAGPFHIDSLV